MTDQQPCECGQFLTDGPWSHCFIHHVDEPLTDDTYRVCFECGHVYETEADLEAAFLREIIQINAEPICFPPFGYRDEPGSLGPLVPRPASEIYFCQECCHDW